MVPRDGTLNNLPDFLVKLDQEERLDLRRFASAICVDVGRARVCRGRHARGMNADVVGGAAGGDARPLRGHLLHHDEAGVADKDCREPHRLPPPRLSSNTTEQLQSLHLRAVACLVSHECCRHRLSLLLSYCTNTINITADHHCHLLISLSHDATFKVNGRLWSLHFFGHHIASYRMLARS